MAAKEWIEHFLAWLHLLRVRFVKTMLILVLALVWAAASNHCKLEQVPGFAFLACCDHEEAAPHEDDDCKTDGCATFENQLYKTENARTSVPAPLVILAMFLQPLAEKLSPPALVSHVLPDAAPTELSRVWQFSYRTALAPRAPSLHS